MKFQSVRDAAARLQGAVFRHNREPVYIDAIGGVAEEIRVTYHVLGLDEPCVTFLPDHQFNFEPVPTGFINLSKRGVVSIGRVPIRSSKAGLYPENILVQTWAYTGSNPDTYRLIKSKHLGDMIAGRFPRLTEALRLLDEDHFAVAFSREWAVMRGGRLLHQQLGLVGTVQDGRPVLDADRIFLSESLREVA